MKKAAAVAASAIAIVATTAPVFAQGRNFPDVPQDHWAAQAVKLLADNGIVIGYPDGTYGGPRGMTRYEFAEAIARLLPLIDTKIAAAVGPLNTRITALENKPVPVGLAPGTLDDYVKKADLPDFSQFARKTDLPDMTNYYTKAEVDQKLTDLRNQIDTMRAMLDRLGNDLRRLGVDVDRLKAEYANLDARVSELEKLRVYGTATAMWKSSAQANGVARGQYSAGVDRDGSLLNNGTPINPNSLGFPAPANGNASGKRGLFSDPSVLYDTQLGVQYSPTRRMRAVAEFILGNYYGAWQEQQALSAQFGSALAATGSLRSDRTASNLDLHTYLAYLSFPFENLSSIHTSDTGVATVGRIPTRGTPYTWWAVDPDTYLNVAREDSGIIPLTGFNVSGNINKVGWNVWGGYNPTDGTDPANIQSQLDPARDGTIGFGHYVRPGGQYDPVDLDYPNANRTHLNPAFYSIPTLQTVGGIRIQPIPELGINYVAGTGDDWRNSNTAGGPVFQSVNPATGASVPMFNRFGQVWSVDGATTLPVHRALNFMPPVGFQGEIAHSQTNNWGAFGVQSSSSPTAFVPSTSGSSVDYKLTFPIGSAQFVWGGKSISPDFNAPGYWGQMGSWVNPWNYTDDGIFAIKTGKGVNRWEIPIGGADLGLTLPFRDVPVLGDLAFTLQDQAGHMNMGRETPGAPLINGGMLTPVSPTTAFASGVDLPDRFQITHAAAGVAFGAGRHSGFKIGLTAEDVLRDYPATNSFRNDVSSMWKALIGLLNIQGGAGLKQFAPNTAVLTPYGLLADGPIQSDENYYRVSVGKNLTSDGSASAKLSFSRIVYNDRTGNGGGSYRGAVGTMQLSYKF